MKPFTRRPILFPALVTLAAGGLLLAGCSGTGEPAEQATGSPTETQRLVLGVSEERPHAVRGNYSLGGPAMDALAQGDLVISAGGCLHVATADGAPTLLVFPQDAEPITEGRPGIRLDSHEYLVGEQVEFGGGGLELDAEQAAAISRCAPEGNVFLIQSTNH